MDRFLLIIVVALLSCQVSCSIMLPLMKPDGSIDFDNLLNHLSLFEQTVTTLQQTVEAFKLTQKAETSALKTEVSNLKASQKTADAKILDLQKQIQGGQIMAEVVSLKDEVNATKTEVRLVANEVISLTSNFNNLTRNYQTLSSQVNSTDAARDVKLKALDQKYQTLSSQVNSTDVARNAEIKGLGQQYQTLSSMVKATPNQNVTAAVHVLQSTLGRLLSEVHSAQNDRNMLHSYVTRLDKTVSDLHTRSNATSMKLSSLFAQFAQLNTEVGFESLMGSSPVSVTDGSALKFSNITFNIGGGYNASTGVFTAPVSGTYLFWTQVLKVTGPKFTLYIRKADKLLGRFFTTTPNYVAGSVIAAARVKAGEQVYVSTYWAQRVDCCYDTSFGGTLLNRH